MIIRPQRGYSRNRLVMMLRVLTIFSGAKLDRAGEIRADAARVEALLADPSSRAIACAPGRVAVSDGRLARLPLDCVGAERVLLGFEDRVALFAGDAAEGAATASLREAGMTLAPDEAGLAAYASGIVNWHRSHPFCARCGQRSEIAEAGHVRRCPACGADHHPRTDPVVIMLVTDGDRVLLGRQAAWPSGWYSALAGFVEPGESLESAVAREVMEEAGVTAQSARYVASQPWPFPASLMLGFVAEYGGGEPRARDGELEDARFFARAELEAAVRGEGDLRVPPRVAIARMLIEHWLEEA